MGFKKDLAKLKEGKVFAEWTWTQIEWDAISERYAKNRKFDWKAQLKYGGGAILALGVGSYLRQASRSPSAASNLTWEGAAISALVIFCAVALIGITLSLTDQYAFPRVRKGQKPLAILGERGLCLGNGALLWQPAVTLVEVQFQDAKATGEPASFIFLGAWAFGATKIEIPIPANHLAEAPAILAQLKGLSANPVRQAA